MINSNSKRADGAPDNKQALLGQDGLESHHMDRSYDS